MPDLHANAQEQFASTHHFKPQACCPRSPGSLFSSGAVRILSSREKQRGRDREGQRGILGIQVKATRSSSITANITRLQAPRQCIKGPPPPPIKPKGTESRQKTEKKDDPSETQKFNQRKEEHDKAPSNQTFFDVKKTTHISIPARGACKHNQNISYREKDTAANHPSK